MVNSFIIRHRLLSSLTKTVRKEYSLIMDPTAGTVLVGVNTPKIHFEYLWQSTSSFCLNSRVILNKRNDLLGESWMDFEDSGIYAFYYGSRKKFVVGYDLGVQSVGAECDWSAFVYLSLAFGVDPYNGGLSDLKRNISTSFRDIVLKSSGNFPILHVRKQGDRVIARIIPDSAIFSIRTGLAWSCIMLIVKGWDVHVMSLGKDIGDEALPNTFDLATSTVHVHSKSQTWPGQAMERALVWVFYAESLYHESSRQLPQSLIPKQELDLEVNVLPVTQKFLNIREDAVEELRLMTDLEGSLIEIFLTEGPLVSSILAALRQEWDNQDVILEDKRKARPYTENPPGYLDIWNKIQGNDTFIALKDNYNPVPTFRTRSDADLTQLTTPMALLARVIIAVSSIQNWPRKEWSVQTDENGKRSFTIPEDPMEELVSGYEYNPVNPSSENLFVYLE